jgi:glycosyltransferase involved in cell wall biosynthesis
MTAEAPIVLHVLEAVGGGTSRHLIDIARHATGTRHHVVVPLERVGGLSDSNAVDRLRDAGAVVHVVSMKRAPWSPANAVALLRLRRIIRTVRPDVVHGHSSIGGLLARLATSPRVHPLVYTANGITVIRAGIAVERALGRRTTAFVATSVSEADLARTLQLAPRGEVIVIPNGIEPDIPPAPIDLRTHLGVPDGAPLVGTISRLVPQKAPEDFVAACAVVARRQPDAHFLLIGEGELEAEVGRAIVEHGLQRRLHRIDILPDAAGVLGQLDVYAMSSRFEGGPYAPLEAMRAGTPVVLTDVVGNRDAVEDGVSGRLVAPGKPEEMGHAIADLLDDRAELERLGEGGRHRQQTQFDVRVMGRTLDDLYRRLLGDPH